MPSSMGDPIIVKDTGDVVVYQYPASYTSNDAQYFDSRSNGRFFDEEGGHGDNSLAAQDALKLEDQYLDPDMPHAIEIQRKRRRRRILLGTAMCLLIGVIVLTSVLANRKTKSAEESNVEIAGVDGVVDGAGASLVVPIQSSAPSIAPEMSVNISSTFSPTSSPTDSSTDSPTDSFTDSPTDLPTMIPVTSSPTSALAITTLEPVVANPSLLLDTTTSEGRAYAAVVAENLTDPKEILQRYSLLTFFFSSQGSDWVQKDGWNTPGSDPCEWFGAGCNSNGEVTVLNLSNNRLIGSLPHDICLLTSMKNFIVTANVLVGTFPDCFGDMTGLQELHVTGNFLDGLPTTLYRLPDLTRLSLAANDFRGGIGNLWSGAQQGEAIFPKLQTLDLHSNNLSGPIPGTQLAQITTLKAVNLFNNPNLYGSLNEMCSSVNLFMATADCNISCSCCRNCPQNIGRQGN
ncbi:leucine rich repeat LRR-containing protein [Nitzschia inconspicua]|uniref:Leucine rich repeat LRR-containing protein n=1 Tax=Nitzschia inconspicua TaxID=303405 RepID=A0A9K3LCX3_9STRA|nr:leucine rich repeat LRR-containing protein [Nitzschia inconspicua]